jgi:ubiquinone/menaquinone biosynthesis C-methylase UbiE
MGTDPSADFYRIQTATGWKRTLNAFASWCGPKPGWRTLDVGCGPGYLPALMASLGCTAFGVDLNLNAVHPYRLHSMLALGDAHHLPFPPRSFHLITASNFLFLLQDPLEVLIEFNRLLDPIGQIGLLNPSEFLNVKSAGALADKHNLSGLDRQSLIGWAEKAESNWRWTEDDLEKLLSKAGLIYVESCLKVGGGLARFTRGQLPNFDG